MFYCGRWVNCSSASSELFFGKLRIVLRQAQNCSSASSELFFDKLRIVLRQAQISFLTVYGMNCV